MKSKPKARSSLKWLERHYPSDGKKREQKKCLKRFTKRALKEGARIVVYKPLVIVWPDGRRWSTNDPDAPTRTHTPPEEVEAATPASPQKPPPATRAGKRGVVIYLDPEIARELKVIAAERDTTLQNLGAETLEQLAKTHRH